MPKRHLLAGLLLVSLTTLIGASAGAIQKNGSSESSPSGSAEAPASDAVLVGAGDIATCGQLEGAEATAKLLDQIPDDSSYEDIQYHIYVREMIERGLDDVAAGRTLSQEEVEQRMARWLGK